MAKSAIAILLAAMASTAQLAYSIQPTGNTCKTGLYYCGWNLLNQSSDHSARSSQMSRALEDHGVDAPHSTRTLENSLYRCQGGEQSDIVFSITCDDVCSQGEENTDDYCD